MKKNILFLITKSEIGGAQRFVQEQMWILDQQEYKIYLLTNKPGWLSKNSVYKQVDFHDGIESKMSLRFLFYLYKYIKKNQIRLLICNSANAGFYGRVAALLTGQRAIFVSHGWSSIYNGGKLKFLFNFIEKILGSICSGVLCVSSNDYDTALRDIGIKKRKLKLIPNSILPLKTVSITTVKSPLRLLMVARLDHPKRPDLLIQAVKEMSADIHLTIVGDGPLMEELRKMLGSEYPNIILLGEVRGFKEFNNFDAFVLISESEGLPISALEAMSCGLSLILSNVGGCPSLISDNGVLVENDVNSIKTGITNVKANLLQFKSNSKELFDKQFNLVVNAPKYIQYYIDKLEIGRAHV